MTSMLRLVLVLTVYMTTVASWTQSGIIKQNSTEKQQAVADVQNIEAFYTHHVPAVSIDIEESSAVIRSSDGVKSHAKPIYENSTEKPAVAVTDVQNLKAISHVPAVLIGVEEFSPVTQSSDQQTSRPKPIYKAQAPDGFLGEKEYRRGPSRTIYRKCFFNPVTCFKK